MEHTHLVKGLDYSLLNKVKGELEKNEEADELEQTYDVSEAFFIDFNFYNLAFYMFAYFT